MTNDFLIDVSSLCRTIILTDSSEYDATSPTLREEVGIAVFISKRDYDGTYIDDPTLADISNPGESDSPGEWEVTIPNETANYLVNMFWAPLWVSQAYTLADVVYYDDGSGIIFWRNVGGPGTGTPGSAPGEWAPLGTTNYAVFVAAVAIGNVKLVQYDTDIIACPNYLIKFNSCDGNHVLIDNSGNTNTKRYTITNVLGDEVVSATVFTGDQTAINLEDDGVYIITIEEDDGSGYEEVLSLPIYEYCKLKTCVAYLINSILCNEWDPCCENCDENARTLKEKQRFTLNEIIAMYGMFQAYIHEEFVTYLGIIDMDADRMDYVTQISEILEKINAILERCELCQGAWQTTTISTTNQGSYKPCNC